MKKFTSGEWATLFNVQYGACFSVIFSLTLSIATETRSGTSVGHVTFCIPNTEVFLFGCLIVYFFVDWIGVNIRSSAVVANPMTLLGVSVWIWYLGLCVLMAKSATNRERILLFSVYITGASLYHFLKYKRGLYQVTADTARVGEILCSLSLCFGLILALVGSVTLLAGVADRPPLLMPCIFLVLLLKIVELHYFHKSLGAASNPI